MLAAPLAAQTPTQQQGAFDKTGFQPGRDYFSQLPVENIDTMSGALVLSFTDLVLPGNAGRDLRIQRTFNSKGGRMWAFGVAGMVMQVTDALWPNGPEPWRPPVLQTADGGQHEAVRDPIVWTRAERTGDVSELLPNARKRPADPAGAEDDAVVAQLPVQPPRQPHTLAHDIAFLHGV